jgi:hypothetical protein
MRQVLRRRPSAISFMIPSSSSSPKCRVGVAVENARRPSQTWRCRPWHDNLTADGPGTGTITGSDTGTVNGDASETGGESGASQQVHATGSATCGSSYSYS